MNARTKFYIASVILCGAAGLGVALLDWRGSGPAATAILIAVACAAGCLKVKLPGYDGTASLSFVVLLLAATRFTFAETVAAAAAAALAQSLWRSRRQPKAVQVAFNLAVLVIGAGLAHRVASLGTLLRDSITQLGVFCLTGVVFYACNTVLVSAVVALSAGRRISDLVSVCQLWVLPYYIATAAIAGGVTGGELRLGSLAWIALGPTLFLTYCAFRRIALKVAAAR